MADARVPSGSTPTVEALAHQAQAKERVAQLMRIRDSIDEQIAQARREAGEDEESSAPTAATPATQAEKQAHKEQIRERREKRLPRGEESLSLRQGDQDLTHHARVHPSRQQLIDRYYNSKCENHIGDMREPVQEGPEDEGEDGGSDEHSEPQPRHEHQQAAEANIETSAQDAESIQGTAEAQHDEPSLEESESGRPILQLVQPDSPCVLEANAQLKEATRDLPQDAIFRALKDEVKPENRNWAIHFIDDQPNVIFAMVKNNYDNESYKTHWTELSDRVLNYCYDRLGGQGSLLFNLRWKHGWSGLSFHRSSIRHRFLEATFLFIPSTAPDID